MTSIIHVRVQESTEKRLKKYVLETEGSFRKQSAVVARAIEYYLDAMEAPKEEEAEHGRE